MAHQCPVCGYPDMELPPTLHAICSCCGTEFDYDDCNASHEQLRTEWIANGSPWFSSITAPPADWTPFMQLLQAGLIPLTVEAHESSGDSNITPAVTKYAIAA